LQARATIRALVAIVISILAAAFIIIMLGLLWFPGIGRPVIWRIPDGYTGWVIAEYRQPACPHLGSNGIYLVQEVSANGRACTSDDLLGKKWRAYRFEYVGSSANMGEIPLDADDESVAIRAPFADPSKNQGGFFVGTQTELRQAGSVWQLIR